MCLPIEDSIYASHSKFLGERYARGDKCWDTIEYDTMYEYNYWTSLDLEKGWTGYEDERPAFQTTGLSGPS